ncbi:Rieske (2Fe-2S) protein [Streptomyces sp. NPDC090022]|uniref:Rieske (2Fe-2S) protein n=1 Tax=Streptomyces sp. NPDC090022 TaxID=3365920 RepID=UPI00381039C1
MADSTPRRTVLAASAAALAGTALAGCGGQGGDQGGKTVPGADAPATGAPEAPASAGAPAPGGKALAQTADIPVGGGKIFKDQKIVVTQPKAGEFKAFSAVCTHQGCAVTSVTDGKIVCPCHQSLFKVADGSVDSGPATRPLAAQKIKVEGDKITLA